MDTGRLGLPHRADGWMPAPIEISAINSLWVTEKQRINPSSYRDGIFDFNVGYITSAILAVVFPRLGVHMSNTATAKKCKWRAANMSAS